MRKVLASVLFFVAFACIGVYAGINISNRQAADAATKEAKELALTVQSEQPLVASTNESEKSDEFLSLDSTANNTKDVVRVDNVGAYYTEGEVFGLLSYGSKEIALHVGETSESLEHVAMLHAASTSDNFVVLGHSYADGSVFGDLWAMTVGTEVTVQSLSGQSVGYTVTSTEWVEEEVYNGDEYREALFSDNSASLTLITCQTKDSVRGRLVVRCALAD